MSNKGMFKIPLFVILVILGQIKENPLIWSYHCSIISTAEKLRTSTIGATLPGEALRESVAAKMTMTKMKVPRA